MFHESSLLVCAALFERRVDHPHTPIADAETRVNDSVRSRDAGADEDRADAGEEEKGQR